MKNKKINKKFKQINMQAKNEKKQANKPKRQKLLSRWVVVPHSDDVTESVQARKFYLTDMLC